MPVTLQPVTEIPALPRKLWTREEVALLESLDLPELERYEVLEGELVLKMPKSLLHSQVLAALLAWLRAAFGEAVVVSEVTVDLRPERDPASLPEPDAVVLNRPFREFQSHPLPGEILLVVEVSARSLEVDLSLKARLYARAGIAEYWVIDLPGRRLIRHRDPDGGSYRSIAAYAEDEPVGPLAAAARLLTVRDLFS